MVDAVSFVNSGEMEFLAVYGDLFPYSVVPYSTRDTQYFTNTSTGTMISQPGFQFDTVTATSRHPAKSLSTMVP